MNKVLLEIYKFLLQVKMNWINSLGKSLKKVKIVGASVSLYELSQFLKEKKTENLLKINKVLLEIYRYISYLLMLFYNQF